MVCLLKRELELTKKSWYFSIKVYEKEAIVNKIFIKKIGGKLQKKNKTKWKERNVKNMGNTGKCNKNWLYAWINSTSISIYETNKVFHMDNL